MKPLVTCHPVPARMAVIELRKATADANAERREVFYWVWECELIQPTKKEFLKEL